ncbi:hypothetical protein EDC04DRAFT_2907071 [Pisolithus marmoratus]|nr:hypothetical protein EDC04DRAFT_2907071 [Pisolithus marmoratus]
MWLIDVDAVLRLHNIPGPSPEIAVLNNQDDRNTAYAIVSHRWTDSEVTHKEMARLAKMENEEREKVKQRDGYNKIIKSCELAKGVYKWLWIDTCCIDKRSSAELSEAINSMYRWYLNSQVCYAYLHDVVETTFPKQKNDKFVEFNGWPEWFTRGWTLQELIAPKEVQFFNKDWVAIGNKWSLASTLECITRIPHNILTGSLILKPRPSVAQIMSWAADRKTARVEDRAYSLLGLLGVNMPMVYGEGERAFRRLQLEIIRESDDQSIFAWDPDRRMPRYGCILADEPSYFRDCHDMERVESDQFDDELRKYIRSYNLEHPMVAVHDSDLRRDSQHLGEFVVTNAGIRIQLYLIPYRDPPSTFKAVLACRRGGTLVTIDLASSGSIFWRSFAATQPHEPRAELTLRWIYLGHSQDASETQHRITLDDRHASINGFTRCITYPREQLTHDIVTLSSRTNDLIVVVYANGDGGSSFAVGLGHYFGQGWVHVTCNDRPANDIKEHQLACLDFAKKAYDAMWNAHAAHAGSMPADQDVYRPNTFTKHAHLPQSICAATVVWGRWDKGNFMNVLVDVKQCPGCCVGPHEWMRTSNDYCLGMRRLMETGYSRDLEQKLGRQHVPSGGCHQRIMLGDYGDFHNGRFKRNGNIFQDLHAPDIGLNKIYRPVVSRVLGDENILRHMVDQGGNAVTFQNMDRGTQYLLEGLLLPNNQKLVRLLKALSTQLSDKHLVTTVVHASDFHAVGPVGDWKLRSVSEMHQFCIVASPHTWKKEPASELRREQLKDIRKHFYNLLHIARTEVLEEPAIDTQRMPAIDFFSKLFGLEKLINYVNLFP